MDNQTPPGSGTPGGQWTPHPNANQPQGQGMPSPPVPPVQAPPAPPAPVAPQAATTQQPAPPVGQQPIPPAGQQPVAGQTAEPPKPPSPPANFQLGAKLPPQLKIKVPAHSLVFDEAYFLRLLAGSISLTRDEKYRIIESIPKLKQSQVDELIRIFEDEKRKFAELGKEHVPQLEKLADQHLQDWNDIEMMQEQKLQSSQEEGEVDDIRKQLGLN